MGVLHANAARLDASNLPGCCTEQKNVAGQAFDGEVFVKCADGRPFRLGHDEILCAVGDCAAGGDGRQTRSSPGPQAVVHLVAMEISAAVSARAGNPFRQHLDNRVEIAARQVAVGIGHPDKVVELVLAKLLAGKHRNDLLRENVERRFRDREPIQLASANRPYQRRAFDQLVARGGEQTAFRHGAHPVSRAAGSSGAVPDRPPIAPDRPITSRAARDVALGHRSLGIRTRRASPPPFLLKYPCAGQFGRAASGWPSINLLRRSRASATG